MPAGVIVTKKTTAADVEEPPPFPELAATWLEYHHLLRPTYPPLEDLRRMSWDQALSDAAREYIGAFRGHVMTHFATRIVFVFVSLPPEYRPSSVDRYTEKLAGLRPGTCSR